jgi:hypothetical protein
MSQVFNGEKMLLELPLPPADRVDGEIYFVDELLQDASGDYFVDELLQDASGDYFVSECFFLALYMLTSDTADKQLYVLGHAVQQTEVNLFFACF